MFPISDLVTRFGGGLILRFIIISLKFQPCHSLLCR
uniref:Uncharacterized protein n=1 Tax=Siphoviridae sp. ct2wG4 TaxID=2826278 RepID=A0A8S5QWR6_9CAUD|nr:MAG TPA: hypothetical protein [Siphoviridae sp. ct2wG4]DAU49705.1 MAG TPA: hypothetical protein [Caudoviricetes sp.]